MKTTKVNSKILKSVQQVNRQGQNYSHIWLSLYCFVPRGPCVLISRYNMLKQLTSE